MFGKCRCQHLCVAGNGWPQSGAKSTRLLIKFSRIRPASRPTLPLNLERIRYGFVRTQTVTRTRVKDQQRLIGGTQSMFGKNRVFAAAVTTAALVVLGAPVASAATFSGPTGFNGDSVLNLSGNQVPVNACQNQIPIQGAGAQVPLQTITALLNLGSNGNTTNSTNTQSCANSSSETDPTSITTAPTSAPMGPSWSDPSGSNGP